MSCNTAGDVENSNATEKSMLKFLAKAGCDVKADREKHCPEKAGFIRFQFTSKRKKMSTILQNIDDNEYDYDKRLHQKGAAEIVLKGCSHYLNQDGERIVMSDDMRNQINDQIIPGFAEQALRTICLAYKDLQPGEGGEHHENDAPDGFNKEVEVDGLTCVGILGIADVIRPEVPGAVAKCQEAGIKVRMVTGDNMVTAKAIAKKCNLISTDSEFAIMEGPKFYDLVEGLMCEKCGEDSPCKCPAE